MNLARSAVATIPVTGNKSGGNHPLVGSSLRHVLSLTSVAPAFCDVGRRHCVKVFEAVVPGKFSVSGPIDSELVVL